MSQVKKSWSDLSQSSRVVTSALRRLPGAEQVSRVADGALDRIGTVSPAGRRMAVYTGAAVLGAAGVVEWPVALTGAAVAWLTQPRPDQPAQPSVGTEMASGTTPEREAYVEAGPGLPLAKPTGATSYRSGAGDRFPLAHFRHPEGHVHEQPAKVGDAATSWGLKQVAEASAHHHSTASPESHRSRSHAR
ncbi:hypothetical protein ABZ467_30790 [Streptomyces sp. NPDC005727]|uniref:hypothetical protein n=1 Tax=Streptomyces sp. NPDC005727 TaxID=3157053 RepID=UPI0033EC6190